MSHCECNTTYVTVVKKNTKAWATLPLGVHLPADRPTSSIDLLREQNSGGTTRADSCFGWHIPVLCHDPANLQRDVAPPRGTGPLFTCHRISEARTGVWSDARRAFHKLLLFICFGLADGQPLQIELFPPLSSRLEAAPGGPWGAF